MSGIGLLLALVIGQIAASFVGARRLAGRGLGVALLPVLAIPLAIVALATGLAFESGGFSEGFARAAPLFAAVLMVLLVVGLIAAAVAFRRRT
jgi:hypothetical protein